MKKENLNKERVSPNGESCAKIIMGRTKSFLRPEVLKRKTYYYKKPFLNPS